MMPISDWGQALYTSFANALVLLLGAVPRILGFVLILVIGWFIAGVIAKAVAGLLRTIRFNDLAQRAGIADFVRNTGIKTDAAGFLGNLVLWFVRLIVLVVAFDALGLPAVSDVLRQFLLWLPNLIVALVILVITGLGANALANLVRGATRQAGFSNPDLLGTVARVAVWGFGIIIAVNQIGVAETLVNTLFFGLVGALALALGLAFGLGGREVAGEMVRSWYVQGQAAKPKVGQAAEAAKTQATRDQDDLEQALRTPPKPAI